MQKVARKKKMLEIQEVAKKFPSNLWKALTLVKLIIFQRKKIFHDSRKERLYSVIWLELIKTA